jgi:TolA-binding protein
VIGWGPLGDLPLIARWGILSVAGLLLSLLVGAGVWTFLQHREATARQAFAAASASYRQAMASPEPARLATAAQALTQFLKDYPRISAAAQASYLLGNVQYQRREYDAALSAFGEAARRDAGSVGALSRLGAGYTWEAKGDLARALETYRDALQGRQPKGFLYGELLLATGRVQEQLKQPAAAIATYRQLLREVPDSARAEEVRIRLAILGARAA